MSAPACRHGFAPDRGVGLWCPACWEEQAAKARRAGWPLKARFVYFFRRRRCR